MAISVRAAGTWAAATTQSPSYAIPAGYQAGDLGILVSIWKPYTVSATVDQSWTEIIDEATGSTANANGAGSLRLYVAYKVLGSSETDPTVTRSGTVSPGGGVIIVLQKDASENWNAAALAAAVEGSGTSSISHTLTTSAAIASGDWVFALTGVADDSATFTRATTAISGGPSWSGNVVEYPSSHLTSTAGNDCAADLIYRVASSGVASGQTITVTGTLSAAERHGSVLFDVWVVAADPKNPQPSSGSLTLTGGTPTVTVSDNVAVEPSAASLTLTGATPTVAKTENVSVAPSAASLTLTGSTPAVLTPVAVAPTAAALALTGSTPFVEVTNNVTALPSAASLTLTGSTPAVLTPVAVAPTAASLALTGATPTIALPVAVAPTAASLTLTGAVPSVSVGAAVTVTPSAASLTLTGATPDVRVSVSALPTPAALVLSGATPVVATTTNVALAPAAATLRLTGVRPTVRVGGTPPGGQKRRAPQPELDTTFDDEEVLLAWAA